MNPDTWLAHAGSGNEDPTTGAVVPPLIASTTFGRGPDYELPSDHIYARYGHPLAARVENALALLEGAERSLVFNSGLSAMAALLETIEPGRAIAVPEVMYHGGRDLVERFGSRGSFEVRTFDATDTVSLQRALTDQDVALIWLETLSNPLWDVTDVRAIVAEAGGRASVAVDATVTPPVTFRALDHGADFAFHSATKYLNGHSDVTAGVISGRGDAARWEEIGRVRKLHGTILPPFEAWLLLRGLRTLHLRYARSSANAATVAEFLASHPNVEAVLYPGLEHHPGHDTARAQFTNGYGGMLSVLVAGGREGALRCANRLELFASATSLGGTESLVEHRATVEGPDSSVPPNLLRLSVGIEHPDDLIADLTRALS